MLTKSLFRSSVKIKLALPEGNIVLLGLWAVVSLNSIDKLPGANKTFIKIKNQKMFSPVRLFISELPLVK